MEELTTLLKRTSLFRGLNQAQLASVAGLTSVERYNAQDIIINQNTPGDKMYLIGSGQVEVVVQDRQGQTHSALILGQGQVFGEMALLDQGERSATVRALEDDTVLYTLQEPAFTALCKQDTTIGYVMMRNLALDLSFKIRHQNFDY